MHDLTEVSPSSSLTAGSPLSNNNLLSPLFTALGWQDLKPAIIAAEQADQALALELQQAYDAYSKTPDAISQQRLQRALDQTIGELQADLSRVRKLEKEAAKRLAKPQTTSGSYLASWLKQGAQAFFGSDDASLVGRYGEIAKKRIEEITQLSRLREGLALPIVSSPKKQSATVSTQVTAENIASPAARHLLETETPSAITAQYCSPNGACDLSNLHDGVSGFVLQGEAASDWSGYSVSSAGDINGDGFDDILVGAHLADPAGRTNAGNTYVIFGSSQTTIWGSGTLNFTSLLNGQQGFVLQGEAAMDYSGFSVSKAGDINGDSFDDMLVGAFHAAPAGHTQAGKSYVVFGSNTSNAWGTGVINLSSLMNGQRGFVLQGDATGDASGYCVSSAGDVNGDKLDDILVGAPGASPVSRAYAGKSFVVFGSNLSNAWGTGVINLSSLMNGQRGFVLQGVAARDYSGLTVSSAGDVNGDGLADVIVGANAYPDDPASYSGPGKSYVVFGSKQSNAWGTGVIDLSSLMNGQRGFVLQGAAAGDLSSYSLSFARDMNGDGLADILVGAPWATSNGSTKAGKTYVVFGSNQTNIWGSGTLNLASLMNGQRGFVLQGEVFDDRSGVSVSGGDLNGDGLTDIVIGALSASPAGGGQTDAGKTYVIFGSNQQNAWGTGLFNLSNIIDSWRGFVLQGEAAGDQSGNSVSGIGDINGDGLNDILIGAPTADSNGYTDAGKTYVVFGDGGCQLWANQLATYQGAPVVLNSQNLNATYADAKPVRFNITAVAHGQFEYVASPGQAITFFNQTEVESGAVQFTQGGSINSPSYTVQIPSTSNIVTFSPQNASVTFSEFLLANQLTVHQGETLVMNSSFMNTTSGYPYAADQVNITISDLQHGEFVLMPLNNSVLEFTQSNLLADQVLFIHDNSSVAPSYNVIVSNPTTTLPTSTTQVTFYHQPIWIVNQLNLTQGDSLMLGSQQINVMDDDLPTDVLFTINGLQHGQFKLTPMNNTITAFTQQQLLDKQVWFSHDNTGNAPNYELTLSDSYFTLPPEPAIIDFTPLPPILGANNLAVKQGRNTTLTSADLSATDPDLTYNLSTLVFTVSDLQHGQFTLQGEVTATTQFTQGQVTNGQVYFTQDDTPSSPSYKVAVSNTQLTTTPQAATISFNARPVLLNNRLTIEAGESVVLAMTDLQAVDDTTFSGDILFKVSNLQHGYFSQLQSPNTSILEFFQQRIRDAEIEFQHDGSTFPPAYTMTAVDDTGLESFPQNAQINFKTNPKTVGGIDWQQLYTAASSIVGAGLAIAGYIWWRRRIAAHRRGFEFANNLREAANLEYHDFMLFDGNVYKNKIEHLLTHLDKIQPGFYKGLTLDEKKSFALCLTETLKRNHLFSPSGCGMGLYSCLLAFSVGWSQELDLREFENQLERIAQEAITAWHDQGDPLTRWPYISPTAKDKAKAWCCARPSRAGIFSRAQREHKERAGMRSELKQRLTGSSINAEEDVQLLPRAFSADSATSFVLTQDSKSTSTSGLTAFKQDVNSRFNYITTRLNTHEERLDQLEAQPLLGPDLS